MKFIPIIKFILVLGIFYYLFKTEYINIEELIAIDLSNNFQIIFLIILLITSTYFLGAFRWWLVLKTFKYNVNLLYILKITYIGAFFNNILFGSYGGDLVKGYYIYKFMNKSVKPVLTIIIDRLFGLIGLIIVGIISFIFFLNGDFLKYISINYDLLFILFIILMISTLTIILLSNNNLFKKINLLREYFNSFLSLSKKNIIIFLICLMLSSIIFIAVHLGTFLISDIIYDFNIGIEKIYVINFFTTIVNVLPVTPGGLGMGELAFSKANVFFSENQSHIINIANVIILYRIINVVACLPGAIIYVLQNKKL